MTVPIRIYWGVIFCVKATVNPKEVGVQEVA